jgi:hypothetical protein
MSEPKVSEWPVECYAWNDNVNDDTRWCDADEARAAFDAVVKERDELKFELESTEKVYRMNRDAIEDLKESLRVATKALESAQAEASWPLVKEIVRRALEAINSSVAPIEEVRRTRGKK